MLTQGKFNVTTALFWLLLLAVLITGLLLSSIAHARYKPIIRLNCPDGDLIIEAKPGAATGNGSAALTMRYHYRGIVLNYFDYRGKQRLLDYLQQDKEGLHDLGLNHQWGHWYNSRYPEHGHLLYLPPTQFSTEEVARLASCIRSNKFKIKDAFSNTMIYGRAYFGLTETRTRIGYDGIAYLAHVNGLPLIAAHYLDSYGRLLMVIELDGCVVLYNTYQDKKYPDETFIWGQMLPSAKGRSKPQLILHPVTINEYGTPTVYDSEWVKQQAPRLTKQYDIVIE